MLASIFGFPGDNTSTSASLNGLQTRASVQQYIQTSLPISGSNSNQFITQQLQNANSQMSGMKNLPNLSNFSDNLGDAPDFKPNSQKTKPFLKRLDYSVNMQFGNVNDLMPTIANFSFGIGYKLNDNGLVGIGTSYKLGLGSGIKNIHFTHEGYGIRGYIDWLIKSGFYISGGYEKNYFPELRGLTQSTRIFLVANR
jgi:hypothetical protein